MAKLFFLVLLLATQAQAQIFNLPFNSAGETPIDKTIDALKKLDTDAPDFEDKFRTMTLEIERQLDILRSDCQEKSQEKQKCFRDVVARHKKYLESSYDAKKTLLTALHKRQLTQLEQGREQALKEIEKQF